MITRMFISNVTMSFYTKKSALNDIEWLNNTHAMCMRATENCEYVAEMAASI